MTEPMTATEREVRQERSSAYLDGGDMGIAHMFDALASGKDMESAVAYAKEMIASSAKAIENGTVGRTERALARETIRHKWSVTLSGHMDNVGHKRLA